VGGHEADVTPLPAQSPMGLVVVRLIPSFPSAAQGVRMELEEFPGALRTVDHPAGLVENPDDVISFDLFEVRTSDARFGLHRLVRGKKRRPELVVQLGAPIRGKARPPAR